MKLHAVFFGALVPALLCSGTALADVPNEPPSVQITSPVTGATFAGPTATIDVVLDAYPGDDGISSILLQIDGTTVATDMDAPYGFEGVEVDEGMHSLVAVAVSSGLAEYPSSAVDIVVFAADGTSDTSGTSGSGDSSDTDSGAASKGCATSGNKLGAGGVMILIGLLSLGFARRRPEPQVRGA